MGCDMDETVGGRSALFKLAAADYAAPMRAVAILLLIAAAPPAPAQTPRRCAGVAADGRAMSPPARTSPATAAGIWRRPSRAAAVTAVSTIISMTYDVGGIVPTWQLLRTASDWQRCGAAAVRVPPAAEWPNIVQTLRYIRDRVIPAIGPVEPVSAYRNPALNVCAGGARRKRAPHYQAIDLVPLRPITREALMRDLCALHRRGGEPYGVGLGFYAFLRFHIDTRRFRNWGFGQAPEAEQCRRDAAAPGPRAACRAAGRGAAPAEAQADR